jgi:AraC-like DNA-binding protein
MKKFRTKTTCRQVMTAFDLWMKRHAARYANDPHPRPGRAWIHVKPLAVPPSLTMKAIAARTGMSYSTLLRMVDCHFRVAEFNRAKLLAFAKRHHRR